MNLFMSWLTSFFSGLIRGKKLHHRNKFPIADDAKTKTQNWKMNQFKTLKAAKEKYDLTGAPVDKKTLEALIVETVSIFPL